MKIVQIKTWQYDEAPDEVKEAILSKHSDINVDFDWWDCIYDDAKDIGLKISGFDIDRGSYVKADFTDGAEECANSIVANHGDTCETCKTARQYQIDRAALVLEYADADYREQIEDDNGCTFDSDLDAEFLKSLCKDYRIMLSEEYDSRMTKESIIETIRSNEYYFDAQGKIM